MTDTALIAKGAYTIPEAARFLGLHKRALYRVIDAGHLPTFIPRGMKRGMHIRHAALLAYLELEAIPLADTG